MQRELFGSAAAAVSLPDSMNSRVSFLDRYRMSMRLDQALFLLIGLLVIYVLVFSFGVETGKRYAQDELRSERQKRERLTEELRGKVIANMESVAAAAGVKNTLGVQPKSEIKAVQPVSPAVQAPAEPAAGVPAAGAVSESVTGKYTIQILTIGSKTAAEKEVARLVGLGMKGFILTRGKMSEVCVNGFATRQEAVQSLKELKTQGAIPADAYVRNLPA